MALFALAALLFSSSDSLAFSDCSSRDIEMENPLLVMKAMVVPKLKKIKTTIKSENLGEARQLVGELLLHEQIRDNYPAKYRVLVIAIDYCREFGFYAESLEYLKQLSEIKIERYQEPAGMYGEPFWDLGFNNGLGKIGMDQKAKIARELAISYTLDEQYDQAIDLLEVQLANTNKRWPRLRFLLGQVYYLKGDFQHALTNFLQLKSYYLNPYFRQLDFLFGPEDCFDSDYDTNNYSLPISVRAKYFTLLNPFLESRKALVFDEYNPYLKIRKYQKDEKRSWGDYRLFGNDHQARFVTFVVAAYYQQGDIEKALKFLELVRSSLTCCESFKSVLDYRDYLESKLSVGGSKR